MKKSILFQSVIMILLFVVGCNGDNSNNNQTTNIDEYGEMIVENLTLYVGFPNKPIVTFSNYDYAVSLEDIYFDYSNSDANFLEFDGEYFNALEGGKTIIVTASTDYHETQFTIYTKNYIDACKDEANANFYINRAKQKENYWKINGKQTGGTVFIGDSFFDTEFWSDFYTLYEGNNVYTNGISSSTTTDWEIWAGKLLYPFNPKNIVMHCGTNNLFDDKESADVTIDNTKRLFNTIHYHLPATKIYYFAIEPRRYGIGTSTFDSSSYYKIKNVNDAMKQYCEENDFMVYLDVTSHCYISGFTVNTDFFRDGVHPKLENYIIYANALMDAGLDLTINSKFLNETTTALSFTTDMAINKGDSVSIKENGKILVNEFSIKGNILVNEIKNNAHIEFRLDGSNNRFLLWDNDNNSSLLIGYACNGSYESNLSSIGAYVNNEVCFELVVTNKNAYLYLHDELVLVFLNVNTNGLIIGSEGCGVEISDLVIISKTFNSVEYNAILSRSEINQYENSTDNKKQVIVC